MKKILLLLHTIRFLKWQQIYFRILRILLKPKVTHKFKQSELSRPDNWFHVLLYDEKIDSNFDIKIVQEFTHLQGSHRHIR